MVQSNWERYEATYMENLGLDRYEPGAVVGPEDESDRQGLKKGAVMTYSKSFKKGVITVLVVLMTVGGAWAGDAAKKRGSWALQVLPAKTLFCVKIRNLDSTCTAVNEYLKGVAPESFDAKDGVLSRLAKMLDSKRPRGVNVKGTFAIFGVNLPSKEAAVNPFANVFVGGLVQVTNYDNFVSRNPNVGEPDNEGISTITMDGREKAVGTGIFGLPVTSG